MNTRSKVVIGVVGAAALMRVLPHPPNVSPILAMSLFAGAYCGTRKLAFLVPLFFVLLTDCILEATSRIPGLYSGWLATGWGFHSTWWGVYGSVALVAGIGWLLRRRPSVFNI